MSTRKTLFDFGQIHYLLFCEKSRKVMSDEEEEAPVYFESPIAQPLASEKLTKKILKLVKKSAFQSLKPLPRTLGNLFFQPRRQRLSVVVSRRSARGCARVRKGA